MQQIYAFIDSQNLNLSVKRDVKINNQLIYSGWILDYSKFFVYLKDSLRVTKAYLFIGFDQANQRLYTYLQKIGYILIFKPILIQNGVKKGNVDGGLILHSMIELQNYHLAVIVTGDGDFFCLIDYLESCSKLKCILIPNKYRYSSLYRSKFQSKIKFVSSLKHKLEKFE